LPVVAVAPVEVVVEVAVVGFEVVAVAVVGLAVVVVDVVVEVLPELQQSLMQFAGLQ